MPRIMKLTDVGSAPHEVEPYLKNPEFMLQQKFDGTRIQAQWDPSTQTLEFSNSGEGPCTHSAAKLKFPAVEAELRPMLESWIVPVTLEGELLIRTGEFVVWDILEGGPERWGTTEERYLQVVDHLSGRWGLYHRFELVKVTPTAWTESQKREMWERINVAGVEGAVSKLRHSRYEPGVRSKDWLKHKLCVRADLVVTSAERTFKDNGVVHKGSASLAAYEDGVLKPIASASLIGKDLSIAPGDVVEVEYLYREPGGGLVQPRIKSKRWDKDATDCDFEQFKPYSRMIVQ